MQQARTNSSSPQRGQCQAASASLSSSEPVGVAASSPQTWPRALSWGEHEGKQVRPLPVCPGLLGDTLNVTSGAVLRLCL